MAMILDEYGYPIHGTSFTQDVAPECQGMQQYIPKNSFFKGANKIDLSQWNPPDFSTDDSFLPEKGTLTNRIKDLWRNCEIVRGSVNQFVDYTVGNHFRLEADICWQVMPEYDEQTACELNDFIETLWRLDTESKNNWIHAGGEMTFTELVQSVVRNFRIFGENFSIIYYLDRPDNRPFKTSVGIIDPSRIFTPLNRLDDEGLRAGIQRNNFGYPAGYFIHDKHPSEMCREFYESEEDKYIFVRKRNEVGREQIIHSMIKELPSQSRGISIFASAIRRLKLLEKYEEATLQTAIMQASVAATIESDYPDIGNMFNASNDDGPQTYCDHYMQQAGNYHNELKFTFEGSNVARLWNGEKFKVHSANLQTAAFEQFEKTMLMHTARALGTSVHHLTQDFSDTNYSGARAEMLSTWKNIETNRYAIAEDFAQRIYCAWLEENIASGRIPLPNESNPDRAWLYFIDNRDALSQGKWHGSIKDEIDKKQQMMALDMQYKNGWLDRKTFHAQVNNTDWRETELNKIKEEKWINEQRIANGLEPYTKDEFRDTRELSGSFSETVTDDNRGN